MAAQSPLGRKFYQRDPVVCARDLVGCILRWGRFSGRVVETEAYDAEGDEASHTFFRPSARVFIANHQPGDTYVYFNYGVHWMLNVLVKGRREGFVLFRALEPLEGIEEMKVARGGLIDPTHLCSGPGKLTQALGITGQDHGMDLCADPAHAFYRSKRSRPVVATPRIGITRAVDFPWRFCEAESLHVSGARKSKRAGRGFKPARPETQ